MNQEGRNNTEMTLKLLMQDFNAMRQRKNIFEGGVFCNYPPHVMADALIRLQDQNLLSVAKLENIDLIERPIVSQYSPDDLLSFFKHFCEQEEAVPALVKEVYHSSLFHE